MAEQAKVKSVYWFIEPDSRGKLTIPQAEPIKRPIPVQRLDAWINRHIWLVLLAAISPLAIAWMAHWMGVL